MRNYGLPFKFERDMEALTQRDTTKRLHFVEASWVLLKNSEALARYMSRAASGPVGRWARGRPDRGRLADPEAPVLEPLLGPLEALLCTLAEAIFQEQRPEVLRRRVRETIEAGSGRCFEDDRE